MRNLYSEIMDLVKEMYPEIFNGDSKKLGEATGHIADALGSMFALIEMSAPNKDIANEARKMMIERTSMFWDEVKKNNSKLI